MKAMLLLTMTLLTSCAGLGLGGMPGAVSVSKSDYDGTVHIRMEPGWANNDMSGTMLLGLRTAKGLKEDKVLLIVRNNIIKHFSTMKYNFYIKIKSKEIKLSPVSKNTECSVSTSSAPARCSQEYIIPLSLVSKMVDAGKDTKFKLLLRDSFVEGSLLKSGMTTARTGFKDFLIKLKAKK